MEMLDNTIEYYSKNANRFFQKYEKLQFEEINTFWTYLMPPDKVKVLDIGAGSGRDALWMAQKGHDVIAVEPADGLRALAKKKHSRQPIRWVKDNLPELQKINRLELKFELILLNAVWMHVPPRFKEEAFNNLVGLLSEGGNLVITLRYGPSPDERMMYPICKKEFTLFTKAKRVSLVKDIKSDDLFGRPDVSWETIIFQKN